MKKIYFFAIAILAFSFTGIAQFDDDIESYPLGVINTGPWGSWDEMPNTADDISVTDEEANSGTKSILVAEGGVIDGVLKLGDKTTGTWQLDFQMLIPSGKSGYFNIQNTESPGTQWNFHATFNEGGASPGLFIFYDASGANQGPGAIQALETYPVGEWFLISMVIDLDASIIQLSLDGALIANVPYTGDQLGGINFYSNEGGGESNRFYVDDAVYAEGTLGVEDFNTAVFSVYPNPVKDVLNIQTQSSVEKIEVYDILGKMVLLEQPNKISPSIQMDELASGAYLVKITINGYSKTIKVLK